MNSGHMPTVADNPPTPPAPSIRLMMVDDHPMFREGLAALIGSQTDMSIVCEADSADAARAAIQAHSPDVILLDLRIPGAAGTEVVGEMAHSNRRTTPVIVLSACEGGEDIVQSFKAGALAYLFKTSARHDILAAIRKLELLADFGKEGIPGDARQDGRHDPIQDQLLYE